MLLSTHEVKYEYSDEVARYVYKNAVFDTMRYCSGTTPQCRSSTISLCFCRVCVCRGRSRALHKHCPCVALAPIDPANNISLFRSVTLKYTLHTAFLNTSMSVPKTDAFNYQALFKYTTSMKELCAFSFFFFFLLDCE